MTYPREPSSRRGTNASAVMSSIRATSGTSSSSSGIARPGVRQATTKRASTARHQLTAASLMSATSAASRIGRAGAASPAESLLSSATGTKRKERDFEGQASSSMSTTADPAGSVIVSLAEETNINVVVRCRGRNDREVRENSAVVVNTDGAKGKTVELMMGPNALSNKTYNFDRVFSPAADQGMIFDDVVKPILDEMLSGFNCTIFAYGQTGTGKTYTMSGDMSETLGLLTDAAGIIPRVLQALFNKLKADENDSIVRCSFIELYNEELRDLLSAEADSGSSSKLKIYDDNSKKGHATTVVQGMEERHIASAADGIKRLQEGSLRRQVAATKCNDLSSRSHTVFTITVQTKRVTETGEDYFNTGKLNLVDLAGSENIQRSGAENKRAAEAGLINKSLLTLGRVINALVDRTAHVPYRESKLTRLLQDSLGGRTKTCIIATISTAKSNLEETISTLDYAFRAKNIRNKPQVNQLINKKTLLREFTAEIEKLKSDLIATRQRNGVYLPNDTYEEITVQSESRRILSEEQAAKIETMEANLRHKLQELLELTGNFMDLKKDNEGTKLELDNTKEVLDQTELVLTATRRSLADETYVREAHQATEQQLATIGSELISTLGRTVGDIDGLRAKNRRKSDLQSINRSAWAGSQAKVSTITSLVESRILDLKESQQEHISSISHRMHSFVEEGQQSLASTQALLDENLASFEASKQGLLSQQGASKEDMDKVLQEIRAVRDHIQDRVGESLRTIASAAERIADDVLSELTEFHGQLHTSYNDLGQDCKGVFEDLLAHLHAQKEESEALRKQVEEASRTVVESNTTVAAQIEEAIEEERQQAAEDRQLLLTQISSLIAAQADTQEKRRAAKAGAIRTRITESSTVLGGDLDAYAAGMELWNATADTYVQSATKSRDALKQKLENDWAAADEHSRSIQNTTKMVNAETVRVVDEQIKDFDVKMQDLDDLVTGAEACNREHLDKHIVSVGNMSGVVTATFAQLSNHAQETVGRAEAFVEDVEASTGELRDNWEPVDETLCEPLSDLRAGITGTSIHEYIPTGQTPEKVQYKYALDLPRTAPRHVLLAALNPAPAPASAPTPTPPSEGQGDDDEDAAAVKNEGEEDYSDELLDIMPSPTKRVALESIVSTVPVVFSDLEDDAKTEDSEPRPFAFARASSQPPPSSASSTPSTSLREVNPNTAPVVGTASSTPGSTVVEKAISISGIHPPSRRVMRQHGAPPPTKQARTRGASMIGMPMGAGAERENMPPSAFSQSLARRRSPRLN